MDGNIPDTSRMAYPRGKENNLLRTVITTKVIFIEVINQDKEYISLLIHNIILENSNKI
jgi:hypothetical protein